MEHEVITDELIAILDKHPEIKDMLIKSIAMAKEINPDKNTNPAQTLQEYYQFLDWTAKPLPWNVLPNADYPSIYSKIDQGVCYFYFILDMPLPELEGKGYYYNSLQYVEPIQSWIKHYCQNWGQFLSTEKSWDPSYYQLLLSEKRFNLQNGWYEDPSNWFTFNDFFSRQLKSPEIRPIAAQNDNSVVVSPADSYPQGVWKIDGDSHIVQKEGVTIKSTVFDSIPEIMGAGSYYRDAFANGTLTHTFLDVDDYHRYHFPVSGTIKAAYKIDQQDAAGGITIWDAAKKRYILHSDIPGWQSFETRGCVVVDTKEYGLVAILPVGMSQISSVNFEDTVKVGAEVKKGDKLGYFLFGGSDIIMIFQKDAGFHFDVAENEDKTAFKHVSIGQAYGRLGIH